jgi:hypothetical protein
MDITNMSNLVAVHYSLWFNGVIPESGTPIYDIDKIITQSGINKEEPAWGPVERFHYWAKPALGYYRSDNEIVMRNHIAQLQSAGADFIILDNTNAISAWAGEIYENMFAAPATLFMSTLKTMRAEGLSTPCVVFWTGSWNRQGNDPAFTGNDIYNRFYAGGAYSDLFVYYSGKPLLLVTDLIPPELTTYFTIRKMWGLYSGSIPDKEWSFLQPHPQLIGKNGSLNEQISVTPAFQADYISNTDTSTPRRGGITFAAQWKRAFEVRPKVLTVTWWNEWAAQRFTPGGITSFVDNYSPEYSRDIEPATGSLGDSFYRYLNKYIADYKANKPFPQGQVQDSFDLGDFEYGTDSWKPSTNAASATSVFSATGVSVPASKTKYKLLEVYSNPVNGDAWRTTLRTFERPVDFSEYNQIQYAIQGWGGAPGATSYMSSITLVSETGQVLTKTTTLSDVGTWQNISLDFRSWPYRNAIKAIEIGYRAVGGNVPWAGKFFVDNVRATTDSYSVGDFEYDVEGWAASANVSTVTSTTAGIPNDPVPRYGNKMLNIQGAAVNGSVLKTVKKEFATAMNMSAFSKFRYGFSGWAGAPGATGYVTRVILTSSTGATLSQDFNLSSGLYPNWQDITLDIGCWAHQLKKIEIGFLALNGNAPWAGKFFVDYARFTKL